jgi:NDP-sugar pyrophosphorylase family protein
MASYALDACMAAGISRFAVNTHHLADQWKCFNAPPDASLDFFHEHILLETGGGLKNIEAWISGKPTLVHNGDILTTLPLRKLIDCHEASGNLVTLALRSQGPPAHIALDASGTRVADIRNMLCRADGTHGFTGVYCVNPEFLRLLPEGEIVSIIPAFLECARLGKLGAVVIDDGLWLDLGDRDSYLQAHRDLDLAPKVHPKALIDPTACIENSIVGPGARVDGGAQLKGCVVWPGAHVKGQAALTNCIIATEAHGTGHGVDFA